MSKDNPQLNGNAAAMREALVEISKLADDWESYAYTKNGALDRIYELANAAHSAPPRNCDVGTADEQAKRHAAYCSLSRSCFHTGCIRRCFAEWAQLPYDEPTTTTKQEESK